MSPGHLQTKQGLIIDDRFAITVSEVMNMSTDKLIETIMVDRTLRGANPHRTIELIKGIECIAAYALLKATTDVIVAERTHKVV